MEVPRAFIDANFHHLDIKPENMLFDEDTNDVMIVDYGTSRHCSYDMLHRNGFAYTPGCNPERQCRNFIGKSHKTNKLQWKSFETKCVILKIIFLSLIYFLEKTLQIYCIFSEIPSNTIIYA
jgi:serine/threonine protein kinase